MKERLSLLLLGICLAPTVALAHHSFAAEFDVYKTVKLQGKVTRVEWANPHVWIVIDGKDEKGLEGQWRCEANSTPILRRLGWTKDTLKPGDPIVIEGFRARNGTNACNARIVTGAEGKRLLAGSAVATP